MTSTMTSWMLVTLAVSSALGLLATVGDRVAAGFGLPRRFVWLVAALLAVIVPLIGGLAPERSPTTAIANVSHPSVIARALDVRAAHTFVVVPESSLSPRRVTRFDDWVKAVWLLFSGVMLARLLFAMNAVRREARNWQHTADETGLLYVAPECGPAATGIFRPRIVIPRWLLNEDEDTRALLVQHELEHVLAGDTKLILAGALFDVLFPWNVALRWISRRLRLAIEIDCDARVVARLRRPRQYGLALLAVSERFAAPPPLAAPLFSSSAGIEARIEALATPRVRRVRRGATSLGALALVAAGVCAFTHWPLLITRTTISAPVQANRRVLPETTDTAFSAKLLARDSSERKEMARKMEDIRAWMAQYHPDVASRPGVNAVTFVADSGGHYVTSIAEALSHDALAKRLGAALYDESVGERTQYAPSPPPDPEPWLGLGLRRTQIHHMAIIQARANVWAPQPFFIVVLYLKDRGR